MLKLNAVKSVCFAMLRTLGQAGKSTVYPKNAYHEKDADGCLRIREDSCPSLRGVEGGASRKDDEVAGGGHIHLCLSPQTLLPSKEGSGVCGGQWCRGQGIRDDLACVLDSRGGGHSPQTAAFRKLR